ncbi:hypothetical protein Tco_0455476 [Tanacetum coccineum]
MSELETRYYIGVSSLSHLRLASVDMGSFTSIMKPSDVKALTRKYKIPRDLHPVVVSSEWTMDRLTDEYIGLYEQYFEFRAKLKKWKGRFFFIDRRAIPDAMCWRHHDSDISDPAPKDGFDEADVIALTHQSIDIRGIPSGLLFSAGLAITWEFPKFRPLFKDPEGHVVTMSEYLRLPFLSGMTIEAGEALTEQDVIPQHTTTPLNADEQVPEKTDSQQRVEASDPKIVATRIRKAHAAAKRKAEKNRESEGAGGSEGSSKRRKPSSGPGEGDKEKPSDHIPCPTPLRTIVGVTSDVSRGDGVISPTQTQGDNLVEIPAHDSANTTTRLHEEHHDEHSGVLGNRDGNFDDDVDEEIDIEGPDRHVSDTTERVVIETEPIPTAATRPDNGKSIAQEETPMPDPLSKGVGADGAGSSLPPSLFVPDLGYSPEESSDHSRGVPQLREEHAQCFEGLAVVQAENDSLMATNAEQARSIKELLGNEVPQGPTCPLPQKEKNSCYEEASSHCVERLAEERSEEELYKIMMRMNGFDSYSDKKMTAEYERLFSKTYPYVDRISHLSEKPVQDLLKLHPAPPPRDAPKVGSGGIVFAPKLVRAAEVAHSKDTTSKEFSRSKTGPSLQDPASKQGSKAPPSKKT